MSDLFKEPIRTRWYVYAGELPPFSHARITEQRAAFYAGAIAIVELFEGFGEPDEIADTVAALTDEIKAHQRGSE